MPASHAPDFPVDHSLVDHSLTALPALRGLALVIAIALAILALPGYLAASVPPALALQD